MSASGPTQTLPRPASVSVIEGAAVLVLGALDAEAVLQTLETKAKSSFDRRGTESRSYTGSHTSFRVLGHSGI